MLAAPRRRGSQLRPVYHGEAILDTVRWLPKGHTVGNEVITILRRPTRVGIIPVGYQHGFGIQRARKSGFWAFFKAWRDRRNRFVTINGQKAKVIGRVGALETAIDVTDLRCGEGDMAIFQMDAIFAHGHSPGLSVRICHGTEREYNPVLRPGTVPGCL